MGKIRVMLVEDDEFWQVHLTNDLNQEEDIQVVRIVSSKEEAVQAVREVAVDIILMDINLTENNLDGLEATRDIIRSHRNDLKIIMITSLAEKEIIMKSFQHGAINYITKSSFRDIVSAVRDAYYNHSSIHADVAYVMRQEIQLMTLSRTEREVFELRESGLTKNQIAEKMFKSVNTIKTQLKSIRDKLTNF